MLKITFFSFVWVYYSTIKNKSKYYIIYKWNVNIFFEKSRNVPKATEDNSLTNIDVSIISPKKIKKIFLEDINLHPKIKMAWNLEKLYAVAFFKKAYK